MSRARVVTLIVVSIAIPALVLTLILATRSHPKHRALDPEANEQPIDMTKARVGELAPDFQLTGVDGRKVRFSSLRGKPVVLTFFASWCFPCKEELPVLEKLANDERGRVAVVGVNYQDFVNDTKEFVKDLKVTFPALLDDSDGTVASLYGVHGVPVTYFVDAQGKVATTPLYGQGSRQALQPGLDVLLGP